MGLQTFPTCLPYVLAGKRKTVGSRKEIDISERDLGCNVSICRFISGMFDMGMEYLPKWWDSWFKVFKVDVKYLQVGFLSFSWDCMLSFVCFPNRIFKDICIYQRFHFSFTCILMQVLVCCSEVIR